MGGVDPIDSQETSSRESETKNAKESINQDATTVESNVHREYNNLIESVLKSHFSNLNIVGFPSFGATGPPRPPVISSVCSISLESFPPTTYLHETLQLSWALLLSHYTRSNDVLFGTKVSGGSDEGPSTLNTRRQQANYPCIPFRVGIDPQKSIKQSIEDIRQRSRELSVLNWGAIRSEAHLYKTSPIFNYQHQLELCLDPLSLESRDFEELSAKNLSDPPSPQPSLIMVCKQGSENNVLCRAHNPSGFLEKEYVERFLQQFASIVSQILISNGDLTIGEVEYASPQDLITLAEWNSEVYPPVVECIHDLVSFQALKRPEKIAVCAWDGELSYGALDSTSSQLARYLIKMGVTRGSIVPLIFEKSKWSIVAMLAVLKVGGVCVTLDVRNRDAMTPRILEQTEAHFILTSETQSLLVPRTLATSLAVCDKSAVDWIIEGPSVELPRLQPQDRAFIIFTSGSTGKPKGIMFDHAALATSMRAHGQSLNMHQDSRVLQFSSYAFDVSIFEIFTTLTLGATICVPSESQRLNNISAFIEKNKVTWAWFTPSFLRTLRSSEVPGLVTIAVGGEAATDDNVETWAEKVELINGYGPAEATICASGRLSKKTWIPGTFGRAVGCTAWITDPSDPDKLSAIGAVGELLIEGAILSQGYLDEPEKTATAFIQSPKWATKFPRSGPPRKFYRTGDLVQYNPHGTIRYIGRNDSQVKINGQRTELGMVENQCDSLGEAFDVTVVAATPKDGYELVLAAFIAQKEYSAGEAVSTRGSDEIEILPVTEEVSTHIRRIKEHLSGTLPLYMVPTIFVTISGLPLTATGKTDRRFLRNIISDHLRAELAGATHETVAGNVPLTESELAVRSLVATTFAVDPNTIDMQQDFMQLGGDSLLAIKMISIARRKELVLTVEQLLTTPSLLELAKFLRHDTSVALKSFPFEHFESTERLADVLATSIEQCNVSKDLVA